MVLRAPLAKSAPSKVCPSAARRSFSVSISLRTESQRETSITHRVTRVRAATAQIYPLSCSLSSKLINSLRAAAPIIDAVAAVTSTKNYKLKFKGVKDAQRCILLFLSGVTTANHLPPSHYSFYSYYTEFIRLIHCDLFWRCCW